MATKWSIDTDVYDIVDSIHNVQKRYIEDEDETTLSLGIFGFITDTEAKKIQTATIMAGQLGNEMFPTRALLTKNILTHAAYNGITDFNATPATITVTLCIKESDFTSNKDTDDNFYLDAACPIFIDKYEFHLDYDVKIHRNVVNGVNNYAAQYIIEDADSNKIINRLSDITNPYLKQPFLINIGNDSYVSIQVTIRQCTIEETTDTMISESIVENKTYTFDFENQLADFTVKVTDSGVTTELTPLMYGSSTDEAADTNGLYCWYLYTGDNTIRITFDSTSYIPGLNSEIYIKAFTTLGSSGNFNYLGIDETSAGLYVTIESDTYEYKNIITYLVAVTDSENGADRKTKEELRKLIPKAAMSRGSITTETDLNNYFNLINTEDSRLVMQKKVDNQLERIWYGFFLLKDENGNIIPSNTITLKFNTEDESIFESYDGRYILPAGSCIRYNTETDIGEIIDDALIPELYSDDYYSDTYYYYMTTSAIALCVDPLYAATYLTNCNYDSYFVYDFVNQDAAIQFIANRFHFTRNLLTEQDTYRISFNIAQSINDGSYTSYKVTKVTTVRSDGTSYQEEVVTNNIKVVLILYRDGNPYRWGECELDPDQSDLTNAVFYFSKEIYTDNNYDDSNRIKITGMNEAGGVKALYGYFDENTSASIYILAKAEVDPTVENPRKDLDSIAPGVYTDYVLTNIYKCINGLDLFKNYTNITNMKVDAVDAINGIYNIVGVPVVGRHYMLDDNYAKYLIEAMNERKSYIDYCLEMVENSMNIDFKFFNTYGPAKTYTLEDETTYIGHIDLEIRFKLSLKDSSDTDTVAAIKAKIKEYMEDINTIEDWHAPNLITDITNEYESRINFIEFVGFNNYDADDQHIINIDDSSTDPNIIPEFINIRNKINKETLELVPDIQIELV